MKETTRKNKYILLIAIMAIMILLLILFISYTCHLDNSQREIVTNPEQQQKEKLEFYKSINSIKKQNNKPEQTPKKITVAKAKKPEKKLVIEELFDFLTEYGGHKYYVSKNTAAWPEADGTCRQYGGHLVTITSKEENQALLQAIKSKNINVSLWIGLTDKDDEGIWKWVTGEKLGYTYWDIQQPDNWTGPGPGGEDYAAIWQHKSTKIRYRWNDQAADSLSLFILEIE
jgi:hypothetical protein